MKPKILLVFAAVLFSIPSFGKEMPLTYAGALLGIASPSNSSAAMTLGGTFGRRMTPDFGIGIYYTYLSSGVSATGVTVATAKLNAYGIEGNYYLTGDLDGMALGIKLGLLSRSIEIARLSVTATPLSVGPKLSFDHKLDSHFSIGFEADVLFQSSNNGQDAYSLINLLGAGKFWF